DSDAAAGALPADVRCVRQGVAYVGDVRVAGGAEESGAARTRPCAASRGGEEHPQDLQEEHGAQRPAAEDRRRFGDLRGTRRWRAARLRAGESTADGATLLPILMLEIKSKLKVSRTAYALQVKG